MAEKLKRYMADIDRPLPLGSSIEESDIRISIPTNEKVDKIELIDIDTRKKVGYAQIDDSYKVGSVYAARIKDAAKYDYVIKSNEKIIKDQYAKVVNKGVEFGKQPQLAYSMYVADFDWENDIKCQRAFEDMIMYRLHVRGFTKHPSSKVKAKGTYAGIVEKIPYFKELGINTLELMPAYDFDEILMEGRAAGRINYLGYSDAHYFAPKESFSIAKNGGQVNEFKNMVKSLHKEGIEVIMDFHFVPETNPHIIIDCLRFWALEYHIDGFSLNFNVAPYDMIKKDPLLTNVKIIGSVWEESENYYLTNDGKKRIAMMNDDFLITARKFVKSDEGQVLDMTQKLQRNSYNCGVINYFANHNSFTAMDMVSYDRKHNDENGENNQDGNDYNYSWNCGFEGETGRKKVKELRKRQLKNAFTLLFFAQGTPLIYAGDEMGNTQNGNNNPYCQDNEISWINWNKLRTNNDIFEYIKFLIDFRNNHSVLHMSNPPRLMDYNSSGCPDISYHGSDPWRIDYSHVSRYFSVLYNGAYGKNEENSVYVAFNMYWDLVEFNIPIVEKKQKCELISATGEVETKDRKVILPGRTVAIFEIQK